MYRIDMGGTSIVIRMIRRHVDGDCSIKKIFLIFLCICFLLFFCQTQRNKALNEPCDFQKLHEDSSVMDTLVLNEDIKCGLWSSFAFFDNNGYLQINQSAIVNAGYNLSELSCEYSLVVMDGFHSSKFINTAIFNQSVFIPYDFVYVTCKTQSDQTVYSNFHVNLNIKVNKRKLSDESQDQLNIVILGLDSVSRFLAEKKLRKTLDFLENKLGSYPFEGYTRIGDNTIPNMIAALTGKTIMECVLSTSGYPKLYQEILKRDYIDCYSEDWAPFLPPYVLTYPNYTHYLRSIVIASKTEEFKMFQKDFNKLNQTAQEDHKLCFGNLFKHKVVLEYGKQCIERYKNKRKYLFMWVNELAHHHPEYLSMADDDIFALLHWMNSSGKLKHTVFVLFSDHGSRYGALTKHDIGRITKNLPLLSIYLPPRIRRKFPHIHKNFQTNTRRLITPFDLHETLLDVFTQNFKDQGKFTDDSKLPRGISLFREIPSRRSCYDASIVESYCPCYSYTPVSVSAGAVHEVAKFAVFKLNEIISKCPYSCRTLHLISVLSAKTQGVPPNSNTIGQVGIRHVVVFQTNPGQGIFEASVEYENVKKVRLIGNIDRLNSYGNQSSCVSEQNILYADLRQYCYCK